MISVVLTILKCVFWILLLYLWSNQSELMATFVVLELWISAGFIFEFVVNFYFFSGHFPVTTLGLDLFPGIYLNKLLFLWCTVTDNNSF